MKKRWIASFTTAIVVLFSSFILFAKILPSSQHHKELVRVEMEVAAIRREMDSRFNIMKWDIEDIVNKRSYSLNESIASIRYREEELIREIKSLRKQVDKLKEGQEAPK